MACGSLCGEPHTWSLLALRSRKSGYAPVRDDKGRAVTFRKVSDLDGQIGERPDERDALPAGTYCRRSVVAGLKNRR